MTDLEIPSWDCLFMSMAHIVARKSKDRSTKAGTVIVGPDNEVRSVGYNNFPSGCDDEVEERHQRPLKYKWTEHTERNAIYNAGKVGIPLKGCKLYVTWLPCHDCARAIVSVGITEVIVHKEFQEANAAFGIWDNSHQVSLELFEEVGIKLRWYSGPVLDIKPLKSEQRFELEKI